MKSSEIRQSFLDYFADRDHEVVPSSPLVPDDPTLLLVNAGMVQFKNLFLGRETRSYQRAATAQKCARLSGKHNDIEEVGPSSRHHTFFEMLGNFSFGDYFKREAIQYAWEYVTGVLKLDPERLSATVYTDDDEAFDLWLELSSLPAERVHRLGEESNWWAMGDTGPNGPCSEMYYDRGVEKCTCSLQGSCSVKTAEEDQDCDRFWEFWNLVFIQYHTDSDGTTSPLENPSIDTGMGLERITAILQGVDANYETDLFQPIFKAIQELTGQSDAERKENEIPYRVIADHSRAMTFMIADGVVPGNEDRSYVLRMLIRRALRFGMKLGLTDPFLTKISEVVIDEMSPFYPELGTRREFIAEAIQTEEEKFSKTFSNRMEGLEKLFKQMESAGHKVISGEEAFFMHDTHGFHIQILEDIAKERGFSVDREAYEAEMEKQRERSKVETDDELTHSVASLDLDTVSPTNFLGYEQTEAESELLYIETDPHGHQLAVFSETPFYAQGGGQVGDSGVVKNLSGNGEAQVINCEKSPAGHFVHTLKVQSGAFSVGDRCRLEIDRERRKAIERNHTGTHILHAALRKVLNHKAGIQAGSLVSDTELRFDFTHFSALKPEEILEIEDLANDVILHDLPVSITEESLEEAKSRGAMALFPEDYQGKAKVRVVSFGEKNKKTPFSIELCGGTHVSRTGELGLFKIIHEEGVASGVRRVYVATGQNALRYVRERESLLTTSAQLLKSSSNEVPSKIESLMAQKSALEKELKASTSANLSDQRDEIINEAVMVNGCNVLIKKLSLDVGALKELADLVDEKLANGIILFGSDDANKATLVAKVNDAVTKRVRAGDLVREAAELVGGKGGGNPRFAQGGGDRPEKLDEALAHVQEGLLKKLNSE